VVKLEVRSHLSGAELSKYYNATAVSPRCSVATQSVDMLHWAYINRNWKWRFAPPWQSPRQQQPCPLS